MNGMVIFIAAFVIGSVFMAPEAKASTSVNCAYLDANPGISDAEDLMVYTALEALDNGENMDRAGRRFASDIMKNCPEHVATILKAADNISNDPRYN